MTGAMTGPRRNQKSWLSEWIDAARALAESRFSASQIAEALSVRFCRRFTRNSIIGKFHRLDIHTTGKASDNLATERIKKPRKPSPTTHRRVIGPVLRPLSADVPRIEPEPWMVPLLDLRSYHCRWPVAGERAETLFCGHPKHEGSSYCEFHMFASLRPPSERRRAA